MLDTIISALNNANIDVWQITCREIESCELFFIKKKLDLRRMKKVCKYDVKVWHDMDVDGKKLRGEGNAYIYPGMDEAEITAVLKSAYTAAGFAPNPFYELPKPEVENLPDVEFDCEKAALTMVEALYKADNHDKGFINSAEFFAEKCRITLVGSNGMNISYPTTDIKGEFVVQCKHPQDVEQYRSFEYSLPDPDSLTEKVNAAIIAVEDRANAVKSAPAGIYDVVLTGDHMRTMLDYYLERADASTVFAHYSDFRIGESVQGEDIIESKLNIKLLHNEPFSAEGIRYTDRDLVKDGKLCCMPGQSRFAYYLGVEQVGRYYKLGVDNAGMPYREMLKNCIEPISFSDFQMDAFSGHFGGEIRLAYLYDENGNRSLVTGGSVNGEIFSCQKDIVFSDERYSAYDYEGPFAMKVKGVSVAGL